MFSRISLVSIGYGVCILLFYVPVFLLQAFRDVKKGVLMFVLLNYDQNFHLKRSYQQKWEKFRKKAKT